MKGRMNGKSLLSFRKTYEKVIQIEANLPHEVSEVMCWGCGKRWLAVYPKQTQMKDLECPWCGNTGGAFKTGQTLDE